MILFYSEKITPRIEYIAKLYFEQILLTKVLFTSDLNYFINSDFPKINYSEKPAGSGIYLHPHSLLFETKIGKPNIEQVFYSNAKYFFPSSADSFLPFDLFAAGFYLVTRYEEYISDEKDHFGRFLAVKSILYENDLLKKPVVNIWAGMLAAEISKVYPQLVWPERKFRFLSTIDVDNAWAYRHKGFARTGGAIANALLKAKLGDFFERLAALLQLKSDPYDNFSYIHSVFERNEKLVRFFYLLGNYGKFDKNVSHKNRYYRKLIQQTKRKYEVGIHPSVAAATDKTGNTLGEEKQRLEQITGSEIKISRQHYLKIEYPVTFRNFLKAGISEDYSLGYASETGFRAGISTPFYFYDLERETTTGLLLIPFQVMDVTLQQYLEHKPDEAWEEIQNLMNEVKNVKGTFVSVWHNESVNDRGIWKGWREVFEKMNQLGFRWANE
jgi:hypothetical protein